VVLQEEGLKPGLLAALLLALPAGAAPRLLFSCTPREVVRGGNVSCTARLEPAAPFVVTRRVSTAEGHELKDNSEQHAEQEFSWSGPAAVSTQVAITVRAGSEALTARAEFQVKARAFPRLALPAATPPWDYGPDDAFGGWPPRLRPGPEQIVADGALGKFSLQLPTPRVQYVEEGPDARWFYVAEPVTPPRAQVRLHRALSPSDAFYDLQYGSGDSCRGGDMEALRAAVLRHEGAAPSEAPSHYSETRRAFDTRDLQAEFEQMTLFYDEAMSREALHEAVRKKLQAFLDKLHDDQLQTVDVAAPVRMSCRLRYP
jgi:hypothetical protein